MKNSLTSCSQSRSEPVACSSETGRASSSKSFPTAGTQHSSPPATETILDESCSMSSQHSVPESICLPVTNDSQLQQSCPGAQTVQQQPSVPPRCKAIQSNLTHAHIDLMFRVYSRCRPSAERVCKQSVQNYTSVLAAQELAHQDSLLLLLLLLLQRCRPYGTDSLYSTCTHHRA